MTFKVGDKVTFANDYGAEYAGKTITRVQAFPVGGIFSGQTRYYYTPSDSPWFPVSAANLKLEARS